MRIYFVVTMVFGMAMVGRAPSLWAQPDPFAAGSGSAGSSGGAAGAAGSAPSDPAPAEPAAPACEQITKQICSAQDSGLLVKSLAYVLIAVLLLTLIRVWWDKRGTRTAGVRFVATLLPAAFGAGVLAYLDPTRGQDLKCCLASTIFRSEILFQDSALARGAVLGLVPAAILFVAVAIVLKLVRA